MQARQIEADLVGIVESVYDVERDARSWIAGILERLEPSVGDGLGLFGFEYVLMKAGHLRASSFTSRGCPGVMCDERLWSALTVHEACCAVASEIPDWTGSRAAEHARREGILDSWRIIGRSSDNRGLAVVVNRRQPGPPPDFQRATLRRIAMHFGSAHRLRERIGTRSSTTETSDPGRALSRREREVLSSALLGRTNKEIAFQLAIGHSTVRVLFTRAAKKLGAQDRERTAAALRGTLCPSS